MGDTPTPPLGTAGALSVGVQGGWHYTPVCYRVASLPRTMADCWEKEPPEPVT
jgi:hypothetical protein